MTQKQIVLETLRDTKGNYRSQYSLRMAVQAKTNTTVPSSSIRRAISDLIADGYNVSRDYGFYRLNA